MSIFCASSYLALRYVAEEGRAWAEGTVPVWPKVTKSEQIAVSTVPEIERVLRSTVEELGDDVALLLSGGIDSAIIGAMLPKGSKAYCIRFVAENAIDETEAASRYAEAAGLDLEIVEVDWDDYQKYMPLLMKNKQSPLHAIEVALYKAALLAKENGAKKAVVGNGADSTFGGMDKLLSQDWKFEDFYKRYCFVEPDKALKNSIDMREEFEKYREGDGIDFIKFLKFTHGFGIIQTFENAIGCAGLEISAPYEKMKLSTKLDIDRVRAGEPKYLLFELFRKLYPKLDAPRKIPFARPMDQWLSDYAGPRADIFKEELDMGQFSGDQKYLIFCLDEFINKVLV